MTDHIASLACDIQRMERMAQSRQLYPSERRHLECLKFAVRLATQDSALTARPVKHD